jgi:hypothetical protein
VVGLSTQSQHDDGGPRTLLKRLTLVVSNGKIEKVFYRVFPRLC